MTDDAYKERADAAYDKLDHYLRNNLDDADYAEYSEALDRVYGYTLSGTSDVPGATRQDEQNKGGAA